jgi:hypothetical protein
MQQAQTAILIIVSDQPKKLIELPQTSLKTPHNQGNSADSEQTGLRASPEPVEEPVKEQIDQPEEPL